MTTTERLGVVCSHCKEINFTNEKHYPMCHSCGHRADAPRYLCKCSRCIHMQKNLEAKGLKDRREPQG